MNALACCGNALAALSRAAAKSASSRLRRLGLLSERIDWSRRAATCETCHLRTIHRGISHCGRPFLEQINRAPAEHGCGCPTHAKARDPDEHCPLDYRNRPSQILPDGCTCKWCNAYAA